jgi:hypothetical protein
MPTVWDLPRWASHLQEQARRVFRDELRRVFTKAALVGEREAKLAATRKLRVRAGRLRQSIRGTVHNGTTAGTRGGDIELRLRAGGGAGRREVSYARIQELGGIVVPRRGKALAIPLPAALTPAGVLKGEYARAGGLRAIPNTFAAHGKLFQVQPDGRLKALFVFKRSVRIRGKHYLMDGVLAAQRSLPPALEKMTRVATGSTP